MYLCQAFDVWLVKFGKNRTYVVIRRGKTSGLCLLLMVAERGQLKFKFCY